MITKTILSAMNKGLRRRHFGLQEASSLFGDFSWKTFCVGFVLALYYQHSFLNTCYLLNGLLNVKKAHSSWINQGYWSAAILVTDIYNTVQVAKYHSNVM